MPTPSTAAAVATARRCAFTDALQGCADAVLAKAAGESRIGGVLAQAFQCLLILGAEAEW